MKMFILVPSNRWAILGTMDKIHLTDIKKYVKMYEMTYIIAQRIPKWKNKKRKLQSKTIKKKQKKQEKITYEEALGALRNIHFGRLCPNCGGVYELEPNIETIKKLIRHNIRTKNYKHSELYPIKE